MAHDTVRPGEPPSPPEAPEIERKILLSPLQKWGLPLLALVPVLALTGLIEVSGSSRALQAGDLRVEVEYPRRAHSGVASALSVTVTNAGSAALEGVTVALDREYVSAFEEKTLEPSPDAISGEAFLFELGELPAGVSRSVTAELTPDRYGNLPGSITVEAEGLENPLRVEFATLSFP